MRTTALTLSVGLTLCMLATAAPLPQETVDQHNCVEQCLIVQEDCLLNSISMSGCVIEFDDCHNSCIPVTTAPAPAVDTSKTTPAPKQQPNQPSPNTSNTEKHKDVTHETEVTPSKTTTEGNNGEDDDGDDDDDDDAEDDGIEDEDSDENPKDLGDNEGEDGYDDDNSGY
ncbi:hypothetical protein EMPS_05861 [Entomortierella parvispora]|uniref:Extracellular membrane protein CFEM domain-containing protein n=1 Tax=Entomortierella parvispora TaxID=205924 RepID=A0A9P3HBS0_9FUNG|nr:hypothetical protein EMPS_05861 [Entomortierella parvispora]